MRGTVENSAPGCALVVPPLPSQTLRAPPPSQSSHARAHPIELRRPTPGRDGSSSAVAKVDRLTGSVLTAKRAHGSDRLPLWRRRVSSSRGRGPRARKPPASKVRRGRGGSHIEPMGGLRGEAAAVRHGTRGAGDELACTPARPSAPGGRRCASGSVVFTRAFLKPMRHHHAC